MIRASNDRRFARLTTTPHARQRIQSKIAFLFHLSMTLEAMFGEPWTLFAFKKRDLFSGNRVLGGQNDTM